MLLGSTVLDVAIGLVFVYLVISLVCSSFSEGIESILKNRSKDLERGIRELLTDTRPGAPQPVDFLQKFYDHPLISSLFKEDYATAKLKNELPSYIPSQNFALAVMDLVGAHGRANARAGTLDATVAPRVGPEPLGLTNPLMPLRSAAAAFAPENEKVSRALVALIDAAGTDANQARKNIEGWFNGSMDRVSGWYKHRAQKIIFAFGLVLAGAVNVDSIAIVRVLSTDGGVRDALVSQAKVEAETRAPDQGKSVKELRHLGLPIGWDAQDVGSIPACNDPRGWFMKLLGILITGLAVTLGAPFWFDLLNKIIVVRSTVKPAEKSLPEPSKA